MPAAPCFQQPQAESSPVPARSRRQPSPGAIRRAAARTHGRRPGSRAATPGGQSRRPESSSRIHLCQWWPVVVLADLAAAGQPQREIHLPNGVREAKAGRLQRSLQSPLAAVIPLGIYQAGQQFVGSGSGSPPHRRSVVQDRTRPHPGLCNWHARPCARRSVAFMEPAQCLKNEFFAQPPSFALNLGGDCRPARLGREPQFQRSAYGRLVATPPAESRRASRSGEYRTTPAIGRNGTG